MTTPKHQTLDVKIGGQDLKPDVACALQLTVRHRQLMNEMKVFLGPQADDHEPCWVDQVRHIASTGIIEAVTATQEEL